MVPENIAHVEGPSLVLRLIRPEDAEYVHALRTNPVYNRHLSEVHGAADVQRHWIGGYKTREAEGREFYYVIERKDGVRCGLVRLYGIGPESFTWGSWILDANKPPKAALEAAYLVYLIAFDLLGLSRAEFDVRRDNANTLEFHRRFGATETHSDERDFYFVYPRARYEADRAGFLAILQRESRA
ncbi:MAG: GNAT family N-acetyltransferase [Methylocystis sp.]